MNRGVVIWLALVVDAGDPPHSALGINIRFASRLGQHGSVELTCFHTFEKSLFIVK